MPILDSALVSAHARIEMSMAAAELATSYLRKREVFRGAVAIRQIVSNLNHAIESLDASGKYPGLAKYLKDMTVKYQNLQRELMPPRPRMAPPVGDKVFALQGYLGAADPAVIGWDQVT